MNMLYKDAEDALDNDIDIEKYRNGNNTTNKTTNIVREEQKLNSLLEVNEKLAKKLYINEDFVTIKKEELNNVVPILDEFIEDNNRKEEVERKVTSLNWNGAILNIEGYCYLKGITMNNDSNVQKNLILIRQGEKDIRKFALEDVPLSYIVLEDEINQWDYKWAGFSGTINFNTVVKNSKHPLPAGTYNVFLELKILRFDKEDIKRVVSLGDIRGFLKNDFHNAKMEFYSAKRQLVHNLMATYDVSTKSMLLESNKLVDMNPNQVYGDVKNKTKKPGLLYRFMKTKMFSTFYYLFHIFPVKKNKVLFPSDSREEIGGNQKFIYDELQRQGNKYTYNFLFKENSFVKKSFVEIVKLAFHSATSRIILLEENYPMLSPLRIRKNTELIQLWHAAGAFKKFGYSRLGHPGGPKIDSKDHRNYTKAIVSSKSIIPQYAEGFDIAKEKIYSLGVPRTDVFYDEDYKEKVKADIYEKYPQFKNKKIILFAPTFRGKGRKDAHYSFDNLDFEKLYQNLKDEYVFVFKLHYIILNKVTIPYQYKDFFYDLSDYREVNDLLLLTDLLITDYSSICFEFSLLDRPMLFFAYDVEEYIGKRGFYYEYQNFIPGKLVKTTDAMVDKIVRNDFDFEKVKLFRDYFFDYQDGKASERVVNQLIKA